MEDNEREISLLRVMLAEAYWQLRAVEWEVSLETLARIEQYFEETGVDLGI